MIDEYDSRFGSTSTQASVRLYLFPGKRVLEGRRAKSRLYACSPGRIAILAGLIVVVISNYEWIL